MGSYLSIITLNVNGLNAPTKRQRLAEWIQKQDPYICCLQETHLKTGDTYRLKEKGGKRYSTQIETKRKQVKLEPIIQSEVSQKEKHQYSILTHIYGI